jgi:hypothetical protein
MERARTCRRARLAVEVAQSSRRGYFIHFQLVSRKAGQRRAQCAGIIVV